MQQSPATLLLEPLRLITKRSLQHLPDGELLGRFASQREDNAFTELVRRHGPTVLGVARRILRDTHEAEDVLQATFLVLARKAHSIRRGEALAGWLHGVAFHLALRARAQTARRSAIPPFPIRETSDPLDEASGRELLGLIDEEIARLPAHYRAPLILCYLEGQTQHEAARRLGWPEETLRGRVDRGRTLLRGRLLRRGLTLPMALAGALVERGSARGALSVVQSEPTALAAALAKSYLQGPGLGRLLALAGLLLCLAGMMGNTLLGEPLQEAPALPAAQETLPVAKPEAEEDPLPEGALARLGTLRLRHGSLVRFLGFTPDGKTLISGGDDGVRVWEANTGRPLRHFAEEHTRSQLQLGALSPNCRFVSFHRSPDRAIQLWDVAAGKVGHTLQNNPARSGVVFSWDGKILVGLQHDGSIEFWDTETGQFRATAKEHQGRVWCATFSSDNKTLLTGGADKIIRIWDVATMRVVRQIAGSPEIVGSMALSPHGRLLATIGQHEVKIGPQMTAWLADRHIRLWDLTTGKEVHRLSMVSKRLNHGVPEGFTAVAFAPDGRSLATAGLDGFVRIWDPESGRELRQIPRACTGVAALAYSPSGQSLGVGSGSCIRIFDPGTGKNLSPFGGHERLIYDAMVLPDGRTIATTGDGAIRLWDLLSGRSRRILEAHAHSGMDMATHDGRTLYSLGSDKTLLALDVPSGRVVRRFPGEHSSYGRGLLALSPDGATLAEGGDEVRLFNATTGEIQKTLVGIDQAVYGLKYLDRGNTLVAWTADQLVHFWDVPTGRKTRQFRIAGDKSEDGNLPSFTACISPDDRILAFASQNRFLVLHELATGKVLRRYDNLPDGACPITFSPDGRLLAWSGWWGDSSVHLLELATGQDRRRFVGHRGRVLTLCFAPDGRTLVSGGEDTTGLVWDVTGTHLGKPEIATGEDVEALASPNSARVELAIRRLAAAPGPFLLHHLGWLKPKPIVEEKLLARLLSELDAEDFAQRDRAARDLEALGDSALLACQRALAGNPSPEARRRLEKIVLAQSPWEKPTPEWLRTQRALEVLERSNAPEANEKLRQLAQGDKGASITATAQAALARRERAKLP